MIITCQECESSFNINDEMIKETGSKVKCSKCENVFVVYPETESDEADFESSLSGLGQDADDLDFAQEDEPEDDLGLPDLDSMFEEDQEFADEDLSEDLDLDIGEDFEADDLDMDEDFEADDILSELDESDDTDLPDLDTMMDFDEEADTETEALDEDIDDEFELDLDEDTALEVEDLSDQDSDELELDFEPAAGGDEPVVASSDELDISDLEDLIDADEGADVAGGTAAVSEDLGMELDLDAESVESEEGIEQFEELDLSDLEDTAETALTAEATGPTEGEAEELGLELEFEEEPGDDEQIDELDLSDLEVAADIDVSTEAAADGLDLDLDLEAEPAESTAEAEGVDELDFSDLEDIVEADESTAGEDVAAVSPKELQPDLELDFDVDDEVQEPAAESTADTVDELDFSDLGKMLEADEEPVAEDVSDESPQELALDFDVDLEPDTASPLEAALDSSSADDDEEFLDIEKMLEEREDEALELESTAESTELDLDLDSALEESDGLDFSGAAEDDLEFNLLESDEAALQEDSSDLETSDFQAGTTTSGLTTDGVSDMASDFETGEFTDSEDISDQTDMLESMPMPRKRRGVRKPLTVFALILILLAGVLIIPQNLGLKIPFLSDIKVPYISDIKIPYLSDKFNPQPKDIAGNLFITPLGPSIDYRLVDNFKAGQLFVIKGQVKNEYNHARSFIRVTGKVYRKGNVLAKAATVYGGNLLSESELASLDMTAINKKLQNRFGTKRSNVKVKSGRVVPFMIVFDKMPSNLDEYTVEVAGSSL